MSATLRETSAGEAAARVAASNEASERFFAAESDAIARACHAMAERFQRGGRLLVAGEGAQRSDVAHVVVEFLHPVLVGKRALPAIGLTAGDGALAALETLGREGDIVLLLAAGAASQGERRLLAAARARGMLAIALTGPGAAAAADFVFAVPSHDPCVVQEVHEMLYHVLWELVHVFVAHRA